MDRQKLRQDPANFKDADKLLLTILLIYAIANVASFIFTQATDIYLIDFLPVDLILSQAEVTLCLTLILISILFMFVICNFGGKLLPASSMKIHIHAKYMGLMVGIMQLMGIIASQLYGYGLAGSDPQDVTPNIIIRIVAYLSPDAFFLIYYTQVGDKNKPYLNMILYAVSSIMRGWIGFILFILLIELYFQFRKHSTYKIIVRGLIIVSILFFIFPVLNNIRIAIRSGNEITSEVAQTSGDLTATTSLFLLNRFQLLTNVCLIYQERDNLITNLDKGLIKPYYLDNAYLTRFTRSDSQSIQWYLVENYIMPPSLINTLSWWTHTGLAGWLYLLDISEIPIYLLFVAMLTLLPYILARYMLKDSTVLPILHIVSILYVFHGWFTPQVVFITSLLFYSFISILLRMIQITLIKPRTSDAGHLMSSQGSLQ